MLIRTPVDPTWSLRALDGPVPSDLRDRAMPAPVPGDVHTALRAAGLIDDPVIDDNEHRLAWIGQSSWEYSTTLPVTGIDAEHTELVFFGVDTVADVSINGEHRGRSRNMHRTWRVPVAEASRAPADLRLALTSPVAAAAAERDRLGARWSVFSPLSPFIRKKACDFGWDWGPALPGAGIWRTVEIQSWSTARLDAVRPTARIDGDHGVVDLDLELVRSESGQSRPLTIVAAIGGDRVEFVASPGTTRVRGALSVAAPGLWWPAGLGPQHLHDLTVTLVDGETVLDRTTVRVGFRALVVDEIDDDQGRSFGITVNDVPLFVRGFNWIPDDTSIATVTPEDYRRRLEEALALGANLIRVWGGGVFEDDEFYAVCDELGLLVWQDFLFACAAYPEEEPFTSEVEHEARDNVSRLMSHPSLALWNGNNENLWFWFLHDWEHVLEGRTWGEGFYFDALPRVVADLDPSRTYLVGSPSSGERWHEPNDPTRGVVHTWLPGDYRGYDEVVPRFVSEFGFQGPPARPTFTGAVHEAHPAPFSPGTIQRQKAEGGTERINDVLEAHFGVPRDFDEWYWLAQLNQARAVRYGIERFRTLEPYCRGTIVWQLNDCWPALSWSVIDVEDRWKPVAYAVRDAYRDRIVVLRSENGVPTLVACNSSGDPWTVEVDVQHFRGSDRLAATSVSATIPPHSASPIPLEQLGTPLGLDELLIATAGDSRTVLLGGTDREFPDAPTEYTLGIRRATDGVEVTVTARSLLRDVVIAVAEIDPDAHSDINVVTLLPGETRTWRIRTTAPKAFTEDAVSAALRVARAPRDVDPNFRGLEQLETEKAERARASSA